ncbi:hypothetical protein JM93_03079 [Roseibium hamelinense]|uniref:Uncharacterized protein n=1 Tax=Roseibium hamelinense TaxID=150831 RepID=A0A562SUB4_9HYPH|nr:hypothetical protein [Roseibium hamelinense]MTI43208.1 hypothetical protein [Roseibium hamelinense]TWI84743.1 hypothetical protein JM93_03079 [Roseibium hamelinense]
MLIKNEDIQKPIEHYHHSNALLRAYNGDARYHDNLSDKEIERLILTGSDYVLSGTAREAEGLLTLHRWLRDQQGFVLEEIAKAVSGHYTIVIAQSLAWGLLDPGARLNGFKCDVDILLERENTERMIRDLAAAGHPRRVIDAETAALIEVPERSAGDRDKSFVGSVYIPFSLSDFDGRTRKYIRQLAGSHQPLNIPQEGDPYLLYGIDAIHAYGGRETDLAACSRPHGALRVQKPDDNVSTSLVRLYHALRLGYLKTNLLLLLARMMRAADPVLVTSQLAEQNLLPFLRAYTDYHRHIIGEDVHASYAAALAERSHFAHFEEFGFHEVYESMEAFLVGHEY